MSKEPSRFRHCDYSRVHYCTWSDESMIKAMSAVEQGGLSVRRASELYGVPRSTLHDRISGVN